MNFIEVHYLLRSFFDLHSYTLHSVLKKLKKKVSAEEKKPRIESLIIRHWSSGESAQWDVINRFSEYETKLTAILENLLSFPINAKMRNSPKSTKNVNIFQYYDVLIMNYDVTATVYTTEAVRGSQIKFILIHHVESENWPKPLATHWERIRFVVIKNTELKLKSYKLQYIPTWHMCNIRSNNEIETLKHISLEFILIKFPFVQLFGSAIVRLCPLCTIVKCGILK